MEFRLLNQKSRIFKIGESINKLYSLGKYNEVIDSLEPYIDTFKLVNSKSLFFILLLKNLYYSRLMMQILILKY